MTSKTKPSTIGGFQVATVSEVPEAARVRRGIYTDVIEAVPEPPQALVIDFEEAKKASTRVSGLRGYLRRHNLLDDFTVVRQGSKVFVQRNAKKAPDQPQE